MARTIDITSKLTDERPLLKLSEDKVYEIDNRKNTVLEMQERIDKGIEEGSATYLDEVLEMALGKKAVKEINDMGLSFADYQIIFMAVMAGAMNEDYEIVEARFHAAK
ncbi:hypothetical protein ABDI30_11920 [Paenibacillus cisolokensis]|uniref:hypothetical protein n=1 Tax=Paenibacillus cisolokensis TaxID=1658519 RepID=UPI003D2D945E